MAEELKTMDFQAKYYLADVRDLSQLQDALCAVKNDFGGIDVLESYAGPETFRHVLETTPESVMEQVYSYLLPALQSVKEVLPALQEKGEGAILFTTGISAFYPIPDIGNEGIIMSGLRNYAANLHNIFKKQFSYVVT